MLEAYIKPDAVEDFEEGRFPFKWEVSEDELLVNKYELWKVHTWGEAPDHLFHQYLVKRKSQLNKNFCYLAIREASSGAQPGSEDRHILSE